MKIVKPMVTQSYYVNKLMKSQTPGEFYKNSVYLVGFVQQKIWQSFKFCDPLLLIKSL
jgi:hypothetical protein